MASTSKSIQAGREAVDWKGVGMVALGAFCFSLSIIFIRLTHGIDQMTPGFYRSLFGFLFLTVLAYRQKDTFQFSTYRGAIPTLALLGVMIGITTGLYTFAIQNTTAANASLLINTAPLYVALVGPWLLKENRPRYTWPSLILSVIGVVLITGPGQISISREEALGITAGIISGAAYATPMLLGRLLRDRVSGLTQGWWSTGLSTLVLLPFAFTSSWSATIANLPYLIPLGIIGLGAAYTLMFMGLKRVNAQIASIVALVEPISGVFIGLLLFSEPLAPLSAIGSLLVLGSIYLISR